MAFRWVCNRCGQLHGSNPSRCRACGATILTPVSRSKVAEHSAQPADVESLDPDKIVTYGTTPDPDFPSSPDVAPDGSIASDDVDADAPAEPAGGRGGIFGVPIKIVTVCVVLGLLAAMLLLL